MSEMLKKRFKKVKESNAEKSADGTASKPKEPVIYHHKSNGCGGDIDSADGAERGLMYYQCKKCNAWINKYQVIFGRA